MPWAASTSTILVFSKPPSNSRQLALAYEYESFFFFFSFVGIEKDGRECPWKRNLKRKVFHKPKPKNLHEPSVHHFAINILAPPVFLEQKIILFVGFWEKEYRETLESLHSCPVRWTPRLYWGKRSEKPSAHRDAWKAFLKMQQRCCSQILMERTHVQQADATCEVRT